VNNEFHKNGSLGWGLGEVAFKFHLKKIEVRENRFLATYWPPIDDRAVMLTFHGKKTVKNLVVDNNNYFVDPNQGIPTWGNPSAKKQCTSFWEWQTLGFDRFGSFGDWRK
jgi:hypothetical protein